MKRIFVLGVLALAAFAASGPVLKEAEFYRKLPGKRVRCVLCPKYCTIVPGRLGFCRARKNMDGTLYALGYAKPCAVHVDPIEKKPFFHVLPGTRSFSIASAGCSLRCKFCQNWQISQVSPEETRNVDLAPEQVVEQAIRQGCDTIAYTYSEPMNFYEYMLDTARIAKRKGIRNVLHTAGYVNRAPLDKLCPYLDAVNVDLKGFRDNYYRDLCEGDLATVLESLKTFKRRGVWIEITNLILPGYNDTPEEIREMCLWIAANLGPETPIHFSRFYPMYQMTMLPQTPVSTVEMAARTAREAGLKYAYVGNAASHEMESTRCPGCGKTVIRRAGYTVLENHCPEGKCGFCGTKIEGIWKK